jgi:hypothetical protein
MDRRRSPLCKKGVDMAVVVRTSVDSGNPSDTFAQPSMHLGQYYHHSWESIDNSRRSFSRARDSGAVELVRPIGNPSTTLAEVFLCSKQSTSGGRWTITSSYSLGRVHCGTRQLLDSARWHLDCGLRPPSHDPQAVSSILLRMLLFCLRPGLKTYNCSQCHALAQ